MSTLADARNVFPRGLWQPEGSYHFGADALLLGAFAFHFGAKSARRCRDWILAADIGCGCGAALFTLALTNEHVSGLGIEKEKELARAASYNAMRLGLAHRLDFMQCEAENVGRKIDGTTGRMDLALSNPPWHASGRGRPAASKLRQGALHGDALAAFCGAASRLLRWHGYYCMIARPDMLCRVCAVLERFRLGLKTILPVCAHEGEAASRILLMARKEAADEPALLPMLPLHEANGSFTQEALEFCEYMGK